MSIKKRIVITAGGTGGHLYPAQGLAQELLKQTHHCEILFVAGGLGKNRYFDQKCFSFQEIESRPLISRNPLKTCLGLFCLFKGFKTSIQILKDYNPDMVVGFGSYYTVPTLLAAKWLNIPIVLHEANSIPGRANRWLAPFATNIGLHFPSTASFFKGKKSVEVGLPLREGYQLDSVDKIKALNYFGLSTQRKTLLICGGSQGAKFINQIVKECMKIIHKISLQIIHLTGDDKATADLNAFYLSHQIPACVKSFEKEMQMAWSVSDGFIGRSGASTIAEATEFEVPGLLIPYPYATDQHQELNADFFVNTIGAGWKLIESNLTPQVLCEKIEHIFQEEHAQVFKNALKKYKQRPHRMSLCQLILKGLDLISS